MLKSTRLDGMMTGGSGDGLDRSSDDSRRGAEEIGSAASNRATCSGVAGRRSSIIVHCHLRWDFVWQRPQQIFSRLAAHHPVLFLEEPLFEASEPFLRICTAQGGVLRAVPVLPPSLRSDVDAQAEAVVPLVRDVLDQRPEFGADLSPPVQWFYSPMTAPAFLDGLPAAAVVYDCMDELANFRFAPPDIRHREQFLLSRADVVFTGGHRLYQAKSAQHSNVHFYGCGVDVDHYARARRTDTPVPEELAGLPHPIFGYFGVIDERIDYELLLELAETFPHASVVMVGPFAKVDPNQVPRRANIHWLGQRAYTELPEIIKGFDVCLMPFALNEATQFINPTKTLEYMAAGKPVVSTAVPDVVHLFRPVVQVAWSRREFAVAVDRAVRTPRADTLAQGIEWANRASWDAIVAAMREHVLTAAAPHATTRGEDRTAVDAATARPGRRKEQHPQQSTEGS